MKPSNVRRAQAAANIFNNLTYELLKTGSNRDDYPITGSILSAALRRASMELTRALAEMRKPN